MRKIYSLVLLAAVLLVGTNAWAKDFTSGSGSDLQDAIYAIMDGTESDPVIKLTQPVTLTTPIWIGTKNLNDPYRSITLDLNGNNITMNATSTKTIYNMFVLTHGELKVINSSATEAQLYLSGSGAENSDVIFMTGSYRASGWNEEGTAVTSARINTRTSGHVTHLEIGERVIIKIYDQGTGININNILEKTKCNGFNLPDGGINYTTKLNGGSLNQGFVYGARVDLKGHIVIEGSSCTDEPLKGKTYGIKVNGTVQSPSNINTTSFASSGITYLENYTSYMGEIGGGNATHLEDTTDAPFVHIYPNASVITVNKGKRSAPVYASGYAKWLIEGTCKGKTGIYISSGAVSMNNANVSSNAEVYAEANKDGGANAAGTGVVVNSRGGSYSGEIKVTVSGDTKIEGSTGYAVEELVNTPLTPNIDPQTGDTIKDPETGKVDSVQNTKVQTIIINGGTFEGGDKGAIAVSEETKQNQETQVVVYGGNVNGENHIGETGDLEDLLPNTTNYHTTEVVDPTTNTTTVVISAGAAPTGDANVAAGHDANSSVKWTGATETISADLTLKELEINESTAQTLTVAAGKTLIVGRLVLGAQAQIIVEPTARLIVNGTQGIVAPVVTNLILQANNTTQGTLLFNPAVSSNRQPYATVQFTTNAHQFGPTDYTWQRLTSPLAEVTTVTYTLGTIGTYTGGAFGSAICQWDYANDAWSPATVTFPQMKPFIGYALTNNANQAGVRYNFKGRIQGTVTNNLVFQKNGWAFFGNAYTASMDIITLLDSLHNSKIDKTAYVWSQTQQMYIPINELQLATLGDEIPDTLPALQTVVFYMENAEATEMSARMDYNTAVWQYGTKTGRFAPSSAPQRSMSNYSSVRINVTSANGMNDYVVLVENDMYSDEYENGADAYKFMNEDHINFYAVSDNDQAIVATNNMVGTILSLQTMDEVSYTMSFDKVNGEVYALRDNQTNAVVLMNEGATYNFTAQSNATLDGRFQIVSRQEMPTAVETIEETVAPKAIYTIMGQYVGETTDWNNLPAGVYVVDGVKIVK